MKRRGYLWTVLLLLCLFAGCGAKPHVAEKPCVMVGGTVYYLSAEKAEASPPEGYQLAGTLEKTKGFPRADLTGTGGPDGSEIYVSGDRPETVYLHVGDSFLCFTEEALQYDYLMAEGSLYIREDGYRALYKGSLTGGEFDGLLPKAAERLGALRSSVRNAYPTENFQTNRQIFVGYSVYVDQNDPETVFIVKASGGSEAIRFLRVP